MRALGVDYGQRRIGLALSDATGPAGAAVEDDRARREPVAGRARRSPAKCDALRREDDGVGVVVVGCRGG